MNDDRQAAARSWPGRALAFALAAEPPPVVTGRAIAADAALAAVTLLAALAEASGGDAWLLSGLVLLSTAPLAWRRVFPLASFWTILTALFAIGLTGLTAGIVLFLTVAFAAYSAVVHSRFRGAALISMTVATGLIMAVFPNTAPPMSARATPLLLFLPIMIVGNAVHLWTRRAGDSRARLRQARAEHEEAARRMLDLERARIASELHDVVTHNVSVMVVQAGAARQVLTDSPAEARAALLAVEASGRAAMTELRHLLGLLSPLPGTGGAAVLAPQPGLDSVRSLIERVTAAGLPVELQVSGTPHELAPGPDLAAFRVVQEALTNAMKHAGKPRTEVRLGYQPEELVVEVADEGRPIPAAGPVADPNAAAMPDGARRGLLGLRERVALYGGELDAGPRPGGGWLVRATIPLDPAEVPARISSA